MAAIDPAPAASTTTSTASTTTSTAACWSAVLQRKPPPKPEEAISSRVFGSCKSSKGISVAVVDASAIIHGANLVAGVDKFVTVREVLDEVRDPVSRHRLSFIPFPVETMEPSPESIAKVSKFARETGDLQTLSAVDRKLIALTYMLESQIHGTSHLRDSPPPLRVVNVKSLPEAQMPGWGSNVPNLAEWEALDQVADGEPNHGSRILPLKELSDNAIPDTLPDANLVSKNEDGSKITQFIVPKKEIKLDGKKMVVDGIDASLGASIDDEADDWLPAVSRKTHKSYLRRIARCEMSKSYEEASIADTVTEGDEVVSEDHSDSGDSELSKDELSVEPDEIGTGTKELDNFEISSQTDGSIDTSVVDDCSSEQSWMLHSLSESTVACVTSDYAMQNVILQIGLRLLAPGGMQIRQLHRWVLKCHACNKVTQEIGRIFCPICGNGGTLRKVSVTVGEDGIVLAARRQRFILRGTKYSLPLPQGGRDAITKNLILREDQLPHKLLHPKSKKKASNEDDFLAADDIFSHASDKRAPLKPPVRKAIALFNGRRNPNDNHFSRHRS